MGLLAGGLHTFVELAGEVIEGDTRRFDEVVLRLLRTPADLADPVRLRSATHSMAR